MTRDDKADWIQSALARYQGALVRYATHITGDLEKARDVVQDTFMRLCKQKPSQIEDHLAQWLFTVCRNRALDIQRKENRMVPITETQSDAQASSEPGALRLLEREEAMSQVIQVLQKLPPNQQEVIRLKFQNDMSYREISGVTQLSVSNVGFLIHTGLKTIRQKLAAQPGLGSREIRRIK